jgi:hypothetical protein
MDLKIVADALNPPRRRFCLLRIICLIYEGLRYVCVWGGGRVFPKVSGLSR